MNLSKLLYFQTAPRTAGQNHPGQTSKLSAPSPTLDLSSPLGHRSGESIVGVDFLQPAIPPLERRVGPWELPGAWSKRLHRLKGEPELDDCPGQTAGLNRQS